MGELANYKTWKLATNLRNTALFNSHDNCFRKRLSTDQLIENVIKMLLNVTMRIYEQYPELSKYLEKMPVTLPTLENPCISLHNLTKYYNSLNSLLNKYILGRARN